MENTEKKTIAQISLSESLWRQVKSKAALDGVNPGDWVATACRQRLESKKSTEEDEAV